MKLVRISWSHSISASSRQKGQSAQLWKTLVFAFPEARVFGKENFHCFYSPTQLWPSNYFTKVYYRVLLGLSLSVFFSGKEAVFILKVIFVAFIYFPFRGEQHCSSRPWHLGMKEPCKEDNKFEHRNSHGFTQEENRICISNQ